MIELMCYKQLHLPEYFTERREGIDSLSMLNPLHAWHQPCHTYKCGWECAEHQGFATSKVSCSLQSIQLRLGSSPLKTRLNPPIRPYKSSLHHNTASNTQHRESDHKYHRLNIPRLLARAEEIRTPKTKLSAWVSLNTNQTTLEASHQIFPACPSTLIIAVAQALFSGV